MHERRIVYDEEERPRQQPRAVLTRGRECLAMGEVAARELGVEVRAYGRGLLARDERPCLLAQRVVFLAGERREFLRGYVAQVTDDIHDLVIAEDHVHGAAGLARLGLEAHQEIEYLA